MALFELFTSREIQVELKWPAECVSVLEKGTDAYSWAKKAFSFIKH